MRHLEDYISKMLYYMWSGFLAKKDLLPHSSQQLADAKEYCITILSEIKLEYSKRNQSKGDSNVDDDKDDDLDSVYREFYNDPFQKSY